MSYCKAFNGLAMSDKVDKKLWVVLRCKRWQCEYCAQVNKSIWKAILINSVVERMKEFPEEKWSFITVTVPAWIHRLSDKNEGIAQSINFIKTHWDMLMKRLKRWLGKFEYVRVLEQHKSGVFHVHLLINAHVPDAVKKQNWNTHKRKRTDYYYSSILATHLRELGFGYIHDARPLEAVGENAVESGIAIAMYVVKYIAKDMAKLDETLSKMRVRKIQTSQAFKSKKVEKGAENWVFRGTSVRYAEFINDVHEGIQWVLANDGHVMSGDDFGDTTDIFPPLKGVDTNDL